jgi:D-xylose transport system substrate-binding protein
MHSLGKRSRWRWWGATLVGLSTLGLALTSLPATASAVSVPKGLSVSSFNNSFAVMGQLKGLTHAGSGLVGVVLPDTTSSVRYVDFDAPYLTEAFAKAGYSASQFKIDNAQGVDPVELGDVEADIALGAKVIIFDPLDSTVGAEAEQYAASHGVTFISYDRATFVGKKTYYVSFNNFKVGQLIGNGFEQCVSAWGINNPKVFELDGGEDTDPNAISFAQGYNSVIWGNTTTPETNVGMTNSKGYSLVGDQITPAWTNSLGQTIFSQQFTAHPQITATVEANDGLANAVITDLKAAGVGPKKIPTTGQDATLQGMENILTGYQCGSVYKPVQLEAQDAVALATILRAHQTPPKALLNGTTSPAKGTPGRTQPASLLTPKWVTASNMAATVIKDGFVSASALCSAVGTSVCTANGISSS